MSVPAGGDDGECRFTRLRSADVAMVATSSRQLSDGSGAGVADETQARLVMVSLADDETVPVIVTVTTCPSLSAATVQVTSCPTVVQPTPGLDRVPPTVTSLGTRSVIETVLVVSVGPVLV